MAKVPAAFGLDVRSILPPSGRIVRGILVWPAVYRTIEVGAEPLVGQHHPTYSGSISNKRQLRGSGLNGG